MKTLIHACRVELLNFDSTTFYEDRIEYGCIRFGLPATSDIDSDGPVDTYPHLHTESRSLFNRKCRSFRADNSLNACQWHCSRRGSNSRWCRLLIIMAMTLLTCPITRLPHWNRFRFKAPACVVWCCSWYPMNGSFSCTGAWPTSNWCMRTMSVQDLLWFYGPVGRIAKRCSRRRRDVPVSELLRRIDKVWGCITSFCLIGRWRMLRNSRIGLWSGSNHIPGLNHLKISRLWSFTCNVDIATYDCEK